VLWLTDVLPGREGVFPGPPVLWSRRSKEVFVARGGLDDFLGPYPGGVAEAPLGSNVERIGPLLVTSPPMFQ